MRVGWIVAAPNVIDRLRLVKQSTDLHTGHLAQAILAEFMRRGLSRPVTVEDPARPTAGAWLRSKQALDAYAFRNQMDAS